MNEHERKENCLSVDVDTAKRDHRDCTHDFFIVNFVANGKNNKNEEKFA